ncbi:MAG: cytochrome c [Verrucomicrobiota bacterium]
MRRLVATRSRGAGGLLLAALFSGGVACSTPGDDPGPAIPVEPATIYVQMCARCHGVDGRGDPELRKTLPVRDFSDPAFQARATPDDIARTIMTGKNQMPAFGALLSAPKIQSLSGFVRRLGRTAPAGTPAAGGSH